MIQQTHPLDFFKHLVWIDRRPLLQVMEAYRQKIHADFLYTFRPDGSPLYKRGLKGRCKKTSKTTDAILEDLYKLLVWKSEGNRGNQCYHVASDLGQANDGLELCKILIRANPMLAGELLVKSNIIERRDGMGFLEILPAQNSAGLHGKTYLHLTVDELHTQRDYKMLEALEIDRTRADAVQSFSSYASMSRHAGVPITDMLKQHEAGTDPRLYVSWYSGTIEEACPSLGGPLGPTMEDILDAQRSLPSLIFRRLYLNLPGQPDSAAYDFESIEACIVKGRKMIPPQPGVIYFFFVDLSGGGPDDATLGIAHRDERGRIVLDLVMDQGPRTGKTFSPEDSVKKFADTIKLYGGSTVTGDSYAGNWGSDAFWRHGIVYEDSVLNRSEIYANFEPILNTGEVEMLDLPKLIQQLVGLIRKGVKIDHPAGEHDDFSNAAAGACVLAKTPQMVPGVYVLPHPGETQAVTRLPW